MLVIDQNKLISSGHFRSCYQHPSDEKLVVKIPKQGCDSNKREQDFFQKLSCNDFFAKFIGEEDTNLGKGIVCERIINFDNSQSESLIQLSRKGIKLPYNLYLDALKIIDQTEKDCLLSCCAYPENILYVKLSDDIGKLISCDSKEIIDKELIPITKINFFKKSKIRRRNKRLKQNLLQYFYPKK